MEQEAITQFGARFRGELVEPADTLSDVLFEQLDYLIQFAHQESDRLERVRAILMETFN